MDRSLPIYIVIDCSESMVGEPQQAVVKGVNSLCADLKSDPSALESVRISIIVFSGIAKQIVPLTELERFSLPMLPIGPGTCLGSAFDLLLQCIQREVRKTTSISKGDYKPMVFLMTDGSPTDDWRPSVAHFYQTMGGTDRVNVIAVACGPDASSSALKEVASTVLSMADTSMGSFSSLFKWLSMSVRTVSVGLGHQGIGIHLPDLPSNIVQAPNLPSMEGPPSQIILAAHCSSDRRKGYLMRYRRSVSPPLTYEAERSYPVGPDYFGEAAASLRGDVVDTSKLHGYPPCPYCQNPGWTLAEDGYSLICSPKKHVFKGRTQVFFVLDVTGSMREEIGGVKEGIQDFIEAVSGQERMEVEVGLIAFRDVGLERIGKQPQMPEVLQFWNRPFTSDATAFKTKVANLKAWGGGGNAEESSLDALVRVCSQPFSSNSSRVLVLITDQPPYKHDGLCGDITIDSVVKSMQKAEIDQLHLILPAAERIRRPFIPLISTFSGGIYDLDKGVRTVQAFRQILQNVGQSIKVLSQRG